MNANAFSQKDYENKTAFRPKKTNPIKPNFTYPQRHALSYAEGGKTEVRCRMSEVRYLSSAFCFPSSVHSHELVNRMKHKLLNFHLKIRKKSEKPQFPPNPANFSSESQISNRVFPVLCVFFVASLLFLSIMDCKIANIEDTPFVRRIQLPAASARANVTAQPAAIITIRAKMMYFTLTSLKKRSKKRKYTPKTAIRKAKNAITTSTQHNNAQAGWI